MGLKVVVARNIFDERGKDNELTEYRIAVCDNQGVLFEECEYEMEVDAKDFVEKFMKSDVAASTDNTISPYHNTGTIQIAKALIKECRIKKFTGNYKNREVLYWMGYIYRYWVFWLGDSSIEVYNKADFETMERVYSYMHTLSPEQAILKLRK
jgi:hypothetical protein